MKQFKILRHIKQYAFQMLSINIKTIFTTISRKIYQNKLHITLFGKLGFIF